MASPYQQPLGSQPRLPVSQQQHYPSAQGLVLGGLGSAPQSMVPSVVGEGQVGMGDPGLVGSGSGTSNVAGPGVGQSAQPHKDFNTALLCRIGQETVQETVAKTTELFQMLKILQPPNGTAQSLSGQEDKKIKLQESLKTIGMLFKRLRRIYEKCNENCSGMEYTHIESLVPIKDDLEPKLQEDKKVTEAVKYLTEEMRELVDQVMLKNRQLKEVIDTLRTIIWEVNTMLAMRKP